MKKFLTVLLALSVVFTYTVGTAFAVTPTTAADAQEAMEKAVNEYYADNFAYNTNGKLVSVAGSTNNVDTNLTKTAVDVAVAQLITDYKNKITEASVQDTDVTEAWTNDLGTDANKLFEVLVGDDGVSAYAATDGVLYTKAVADAKTAATAYMDSINAGMYSTEDARVINSAKNTLSNALTEAANSKAGLQAVVGALATFKGSVDVLTPTANQEANLAKYKTAAQGEIARLAAAFQPLEADRLDNISTAGMTVAQLAEHNAKVNNLSANVAAVVALYDGQISEVTLEGGYSAATDAIDDIVTAATTALTNGATNEEFYEVVGKLSDSAVLTTYAETYAAGLKNMFNQSTGLAVYNAATVDAKLADVIADIKALKLTSYAAVEAALNATLTAEQEANALTTYKNQAVLVITTTNDAGVTNEDRVSGTTLVALKGTFAKAAWDAKYRKAIGDIQDEYELKIKAAASKEDVIALVKEAQAAMENVALRTTDATSVKNSVTTVLNRLGYATANTGQGGTIAAYANSKNVSGQYSTAILNGAMQQAVDVLYDAVLAEKNTNLTTAQITAILQNNYAAALAKVDGMLTTTALKSAADAVVASINALPTTATIADKDQYLAAQTAFEAYLDNAGALPADIPNRTLLDAYMTRIIYLERSAIEAQIRTLPSTVTLSNQEAVEAARAAVDAYDDAYSEYASTPYDYDYAPVSNLSRLTTAESQLSNAKLVDAAKKIAALPASITAADKEAVTAARAAYENLDAIEKSKFSTALVEKLVAAEKSIADADIKAVEGLKITASSTRGKGYIRVNWKVTGDTSVADGFQVYRSTKRNSGFGTKAFYSTDDNEKRTYKNTKSLKKGTRYYYKVRAYKVVDGKTYYSDWSNKAYRIAK